MDNPSVILLRQLILKELVEGYEGTLEPTTYRITCGVNKDSAGFINYFMSTFHIYDSILNSSMYQLPDALRKRDVQRYDLSYEGVQNNKHVFRIWAFVEVANICGWTLDDTCTEKLNPVNAKMIKEIFNSGT